MILVYILGAIGSLAAGACFAVFGLLALSFGVHIGGMR